MAFQSPRTTARITVESAEMKNGQPIPREHTSDGRNTSPTITWRNVPKGARELAVVMIDQDYVLPYPKPEPMIHWLVYGIKPGAHELAAGMPNVVAITAPPELEGSFQAHTVFDQNGYRGPQPMPGELHHYRFAVLALDKPLGLKADMPASEVWKTIQGHIVGEGDLIVTYQRPK